MTGSLSQEQLDIIEFVVRHDRTLDELCDLARRRRRQRQARRSMSRGRALHRWKLQHAHDHLGVCDRLRDHRVAGRGGVLDVDTDRQQDVVWQGGSSSAQRSRSQSSVPSTRRGIVSRVRYFRQSRSSWLDSNSLLPDCRGAARDDNKQKQWWWVRLGSHPLAATPRGTTLAPAALLWPRPCSARWRQGMTSPLPLEGRYMAAVCSTVCCFMIVSWCLGAKQRACRRPNVRCACARDWLANNATNGPEWYRNTNWLNGEPMQPEAVWRKLLERHGRHDVVRKTRHTSAPASVDLSYSPSLPLSLASQALLACAAMWRTASSTRRISTRLASQASCSCGAQRREWADTTRSASCAPLPSSPAQQQQPPPRRRPPRHIIGVFNILQSRPVHERLA